MDYERHLDFAENVANLLDNQFGVGPWKFGLDPIIGLVPIVGDIIPIGLALYIFWISHAMGVPDAVRHKMIVTAVADVVIGAIPIVGDVTDFFWKANSRNIALLRRYLAERPIEGKIIAQDQPVLHPA